MILDDEIIAGLLVNGEITWYVSQRSLWIISHEKWENAFIAAGYVPHAGAKNHDGRFGIAVLNTESLPEFIKGMFPFQTEPELLSEALQELGTSSSLQELVISDSWEEDDNYDLEYLFPSLLLDFDSRKFFCIDREEYYYPYEKYMVDGWDFYSKNFIALVPEKDRYWIVDGIDYFADLYK